VTARYILLRDAGAGRNVPNFELTGLPRRHHSRTLSSKP
jgi:hypothetical protein